MGVKISIIGAGSAVFSINLIKDLCINKNFNGSEVVLMDIDERRLTGIYGVCDKYIKETGVDIKLSRTFDREEALKGADFVVHVALDYGHERLKEGWKIAKKDGYRFGGSLHIMHDEAFWVNWHQLRLMESVYLDMQRLCPDAWLMLVANPVQAGVTYLGRKYPGAKVIGMCHGGYKAYDLMAAMGLPREDCSFEVSGVNHFVWLTSFKYKGEDAYPLLDRWTNEGKNIECIKSNPNPHKRNSSYFGPKPVDMYHRFGLMPIGDMASPGGGAWAWWYHTGEPGTYMEDPELWYTHHFERSERKLAKIWQAIEDPETKVLEFFGSVPADEPMIPTIEALAFDVEHKIILNVMNKDNMVEGVPTDYECESWCLVNKTGVHGIKAIPLPKPIIAMMLRDRIANVELELNALETGDIHSLEQLVLNDPFTDTLEQAQKLIKDILDMPCNADMKEFFLKGREYPVDEMQPY